MTREESPSWYTLSGRGLREHLNLLHAPYTVWHLSYVVIGASFSPTLYLDRLLYTLAAFFLGLGIGAHYLDEFDGHPLGTHISDRTLFTVALAALLAASAIGLWGALTVSFSLVPFIVFGLFAAYAYNLQLFGGRFHNIYGFSLSWGSFPALTGYFVNTLSLDLDILLIATACGVLSATQQILSNHVKAIRREAEVQGTISFDSGTEKVLDKQYLVGAGETALKLLSASIFLIAVALLASRVT